MIRLRLRWPTDRRSPLARWIGISVVGHVLFVAVILLLPPLDAGTPVPDNVVVELVPFALAPERQEPAAAPPAPAAPEPEPEPPRSEPVPVAPKKIPKSDIPEKPVEKKPPPKKKTEPPADKPPAPAPPSATEEPPPNPGAATTGREVGDSKGGVASLEAGDLQYAWYRSSVTAALHAAWRKPALEGVATSYEVTVAFDIARDGSVLGLRIDQPSGIESLDRSALRAVRDASPLPPLPRTWSGNVLSARFVFRLYPE